MAPLFSAATDTNDHFAFGMVGGRWVVRGVGDHWGGIFLTRDAALKFAKAELEQAETEARGGGYAA